MVAMAAAIGGARADNTTALAITWQGADAKGAGSPGVISTQLLPEDEVSSTIIAGQPLPAGAAAADAFDEDEIERAIAEIREAIEKSSQLLK
jgi:protein phosphatase